MHDHIVRVGVLSIPWDKGQLNPGVGSAPKAIIGTKFMSELALLGHEVKDFGEVICHKFEVEAPKVHNMRELNLHAACHHATAKKVEQIISGGYKCICLGGDHSIAVGTISGHVSAKQDIALLWVDAHADLNTAVTSYTGNIHGMPVALIAKELKDYWPDLGPSMDWLKPVFSIRNLAYIGLRDVDVYERMIMEKYGIASYGMDDVERYGIHEVILRAMRRIDNTNDRSIHISFDIDSLDVLEAPSTGTPVRGGLTLREGIQIIEDVHRTGRLTCIDFVEVNPSIGDAKDVATTLGATKCLIKAAFGQSRRGVVDRHIKTIPRPEVMTASMIKDKPVEVVEIKKADES